MATINDRPTSIIGVWLKPKDVSIKQLDTLLNAIYHEKHIFERQGEPCYIHASYNSGRSITISCDGRNFTDAEVKRLIELLEEHCNVYQLKENYRDT